MDGFALLTQPQANPEPCGEHLVSPSSGKRRATGGVPQISDRAVHVTHSRRQNEIAFLSRDTVISERAECMITPWYSNLLPRSPARRLHVAGRGRNMPGHKSAREG